MSQLIKVRIKSPDKIIWEGEAESVSSINSQGPFDVLPFHANFITTIENHPITVITNGKAQEFSFQRCVLYNHSNVVRIYSNI